MAPRRARSLKRLSILTVLAALALFPVLAVPAAVPAHAAAGNCTQTLPAATDGRLTLDRTAVRPGSYTLAYVSGFRQWPQGLVGGGSGETFESCTPWLEGGQAEVMIHDSAGFFRFLVPAGTASGTYSVSVIFNEGSTQPMDYTNTRRLSAQLTVSPNAPVTTTTSTVCRLAHAAATAGSLQAPSSARPGSSINVSLRGVPAVGYLNEYGGILRFITCLGGNATAVTGTTMSATVPVPSNLADGDYDIAVTGATTGTMSVVVWTRRIHVQADVAPPTTSSAPAVTTSAPPATSAAPTSQAPSTSTSAAPSATTSAPPTSPTASSPSASAVSGKKDGSSAAPWLVGALLVVLLGAGGSVVWLRRHHTAG